MKITLVRENEKEKKNLLIFKVVDIALFMPYMQKEFEDTKGADTNR